MIIRKYNYKLETGVVGTDDDNIASILYNINRMEMRVSFTSSDREELDRETGHLFFLIVDAKVHLLRFLKIFDNKVEADTVNTLMETLDESIETVRADRTSSPDKMSALFATVYYKLLNTVPTVLALDAQATGRVKVVKPYSSHQQNDND